MKEVYSKKTAELAAREPPTKITKKTLADSADQLLIDLKRQRDLLKELEKTSTNSTGVKKFTQLSLHLDFLDKTIFAISDKYSNSIKEMAGEFEAELEKEQVEEIVGAFKRFTETLNTIHSFSEIEQQVLEKEEKYNNLIAKADATLNTLIYPEEYLKDSKVIQELLNLDQLKKEFDELNKEIQVLLTNSEKNIAKINDSYDKACQTLNNYNISLFTLSTRVKALWQKKDKLLEVSPSANAYSFKDKLKSVMGNKKLNSNEKTSQEIVTKEAIRLSKVGFLAKIKDANFLYNQIIKNIAELEEPEEYDVELKSSNRLKGEIDKLVGTKPINNSNEAELKLTKDNFYKVHEIYAKLLSVNQSILQVNLNKKRLPEEKNRFNQLYTNLNNELKHHGIDRDPEVESLNKEVETLLLQEEISSQKKLEILLSKTKKLEEKAGSIEKDIKTKIEKQANAVVKNIKSHLETFKNEGFLGQNLEAQIRETCEFSPKKMTKDQVIVKLEELDQIEKMLNLKVENFYQKRFEEELQGFHTSYSNLEKALDSSKKHFEGFAFDRSKIEGLNSRINSLKNSFENFKEKLDKILSYKQKLDDEQTHLFKEVQSHIEDKEIKKKIEEQISIFDDTDKKSDERLNNYKLKNGEIDATSSFKKIDKLKSHKKIEEIRSEFLQEKINQNTSSKHKLEKLIKINQRLEKNIETRDKEIIKIISDVRKDLAKNINTLLVNIEDLGEKTTFNDEEFNSISKLKRKPFELKESSPENLFKEGLLFENTRNIEEAIKEVEEIKEVHTKALEIGRDLNKLLGALDHPPPKGEKIFSAFILSRGAASATFNFLLANLNNINNENQKINLNQFILKREIRLRKIDIENQKKMEADRIFLREQGQDKESIPEENFITHSKQDAFKNFADLFKAKILLEDQQIDANNLKDYLQSDTTREVILTLMRLNLTDKVTPEVLNNFKLCEVITLLNKEHPLTREHINLLIQDPSRVEILFRQVNETGKLSEDFKDFSKLILELDNSQSSKEIIEVFKIIQEHFPEPKQRSLNLYNAIKDNDNLRRSILESKDLPVTFTFLKNFLDRMNHLDQQNTRPEITEQEEKLFKLISQTNYIDNTDEIMSIYKVIQGLDQLAADYNQDIEKEKSIKNLRNESLLILLEDKPREERRNQVINLAVKAFRHDDKILRAVADVLMFLTLTFVVIVPIRILMNKTSLFSSSETNRTDQVLSIMDTSSDKTQDSSFKSRFQSVLEVPNQSKVEQGRSPEENIEENEERASLLKQSNKPS